MNKKGFTLVELLATIVILGIVVGISIVGININMKNTRKKTEEVFIDSIRDAMSMYLGSPEKKLTFSQCGSFTKNTTGTVKVYKASTTFKTVIELYHSLEESDLVNPANDQKCNVNANVTVYRDSDFVYYYKINKSEFGCFEETDTIDNLPEGFSGC